MNLLVLLALALPAFLLCSAQAASVGPSGYTNDFNTAVPASTDWSTANIAGGVNDVIDAAGLDGAVQVLNAGSITTAIRTDSSNLPPAHALATWSSTGYFLQTRPTSVKLSLFMATLVNNTGANANCIKINYDFTAATSVAEQVLGHRVYYSFDGAAGNWGNISALNSPPNGRVSTNVILNSTWNDGATLYLLWADDNGTGSPDNANQIDNFYLTAYYTNIPLSIALIAPAHGQHLAFGSGISASVALAGSPTNVSYYIDGSLVATRTTAPFTPVSLPAQALGSHTIYATAQDTNDTFLTTATNTFFIDQSVSGTLTTNTTFFAANSPYTVSGSLTVASNVTLTIEPGTTLFLNSGVNVTVANGGRILAEGTSNALIRFIRPSPTAAAWGGITIYGDADCPESRFVYTYFEGNGATKCMQVTDGTVYLDHCSFGTTTREFLSLDRSSFVVTDCYFPPATAAIEPIHGTGGIKAGGRGIIRNSFFGAAIDYSDTIDFTGANRPSQILQVYNNVFMGSGDDNLDLDSTDAWVQGNIFLHVHKNGSPDTSSAVSGGNDTGNNGDVTVTGNIFYDVDQLAMCKQGNFYTIFNNTVVLQTHQGGLDTDSAVICTQDNGMTEARGFFLEGNIMYDVNKLVRDQVAAVITFTNNLMPLPWTGLGGGNSTNDPMLQYIPQLSETYFTNWADAQIMKQWFSLQSNSPALGTGPNGRDRGGIIPLGASVSGEPIGTTSANSATLTVGINRTGNSIPVSDWPNGAGYTHYRWRLDTNTWSAETSINTPITLTNLADGPHQVEVIGKNDGGLYQNDPELGPNATSTQSRLWIVQSNLRITAAVFDGPNFTLHFPVTAGVTYSVLYKNSLDDPAWLSLIDVPAQDFSGDYRVTDSSAGGQARFYRIVSPAQ